MICGRGSGEQSLLPYWPSRSALAMKSLNEIFGRNTGLFEYTTKAPTFNSR